ncbi:hypothetical protein SAMN05421741_10252 [Paenimyroides ummariense]|uniref:DUF2281 domain-containing protein n=1 Tax=Paenimyroides ummariense TaxID=913024 RepID=A0A1I4X0X4_9FLAO|nr:hypothetical protein [Paenimyroides ummariense]SFN19487.1 hypothetical protein SAMN05421741_10252 [Paenimyroides ummariense]
MDSNSLKQVNYKLKQLPEKFLEEIERYIDFLTFKHKQETEDITQWQKDLVLKRIKEAKNPVDAFDMLDELENE